MIYSFFILLAFFAPTIGHSKEITTNEVIMTNAPEWLTKSRVEKITDRIQHKLEWSTRKIEVRWYLNRQEFEKSHSLGAQASAVTKLVNEISTISLGPSVINDNFDAIFGHELVHVIINQKYKEAIPKWLEEGLANHLAKRGLVNYKWLSQQPFPTDVRDLAHPFKGDLQLISYRYMASQALAEMLQKKCELENLIRLSVQRKMEDYIVTYCQIKDLNLAFREWVKRQAGKI